MEIEKSGDATHYIPIEIRWRIIGFIDAGKTQSEASIFYGFSQSAISKLV